jgi:hypothetical protein
VGNRDVVIAARLDYLFPARARLDYLFPARARLDYLFPARAKDEIALLTGASAANR